MQLNLDNKEIRGLEKIFALTFNLDRNPKVLYSEDTENFRDAVAYDVIPYFLRINKKTGKIVITKKEENHIPLNQDLTEGEKGDLYGFFMQGKRFAENKLESIKESKLINSLLYQAHLSKYGYNFKS